MAIFGYEGLHYLPYSHFDCIHNQLIAISNRVCGAVPHPTKGGLARLKVAAEFVGNLIPRTYEEEYGEMARRYAGAKRRKYEQATKQVLDLGFWPKDSAIKMFVKCEKMEPTAEKQNPDPRAIQFRDPKYCVELSRYLHPIEQHLYQLKGDGRRIPPTRLVGKGLNQTQRASLLREKMSRFGSPVVVSLDASRFDKHCSSSLLQIEHQVYLRSNPNSHFAKLLSLQLNNRCFTTRGIRYRTKGKRMSGDMNTALGNCVLMIVMVVSLFWDQQIQWDMLDDGDDCLVIVESSSLPWLLAQVKPTFLAFGHEIKVENVATEFEKIEWCQCRPIVFDGTAKFIRNPRKVISQALVGVKYFTSIGARARLVNTIGLCELVLNLGVPILQEFALALLRNAGTDRLLAIDEAGSLMSRVRRELSTFNLKTLKRLDPLPIGLVVRQSFAVAWGIEPAEQVLIEHHLRSWTFNVEGLNLMPPEWNVTSWEQFPAETPEVYSATFDRV